MRLLDQLGQHRQAASLQRQLQVAVLGRQEPAPVLGLPSIRGRDQNAHQVAIRGGEVDRTGLEAAPGGVDLGQAPLVSAQELRALLLRLGFGQGLVHLLLHGLAHLLEASQDLGAGTGWR